MVEKYTNTIRGPADGGLPIGLAASCLSGDESDADAVQIGDYLTGRRWFVPVETIRACERRDACLFLHDGLEVVTEYVEGEFGMQRRESTVAEFLR